MHSQALAKPGAIVAILILQVIPLLLLPPDSFSPRSQEWWLPVLLVIMVVIADFELIVRRSPATWPWLLMAFAQGFNVISRIMIIWSRATVTTASGTAPDWTYLALTLVSTVLSMWMLTYAERPDVRAGLLTQKA